MKKYDYLKKEHSEYISKDTMCEICHISKKSGLYLLQNNIIPMIDTGKKTWRYQIALKDVIAYLEKRNQVGSMIPPGAVSSRCKYQGSNRVSFSSILRQEDKRELVAYFCFIYANFPDTLTTNNLVEMTGLSKKTIIILLKEKQIKSISNNPRYIIQKDHLFEFVSSQRYIECKSNSETFKRILGGFVLWKEKNAK